MSDATPTAPTAPDHRFVDPRLTSPGLVENDPDLAPPGQGIERELDGPAAAAVLDGLDGDELLALAADELTEDVSKGTLELEVAGRRGAWTIEYDLDEAAKEPNVRAWEARATTGPRGKEILNRLRFATLLIANTNTGIKRGGVYLTEPGTGERLTFRHKRIVALFGADSSGNAVRQCLGDPGALSHADAIAERTGYGDIASPVDPTPLS